MKFQFERELANQKANEELERLKQNQKAEKERIEAEAKKSARKIALEIERLKTEQKLKQLDFEKLVKIEHDNLMDLLRQQTKERSEEKRFADKLLRERDASCKAEATVLKRLLEQESRTCQQDLKRLTESCRNH